MKIAWFHSSGASRVGVFGMPKQNINSIRTYIEVSTLFTIYDR